MKRCAIELGGRMTSVNRFAIVLLTTFLAGACDGGQSTMPSPPSPLSYVVSGTVSETVGGVPRPLAGRPVFLYIFQDAVMVGDRTGYRSARVEDLVTDHNGRYTAQVAKSRVFVVAFDLPETEQPCLASAAVDTDTTIDVQFVPAGTSSTPPAAASPMITGFVYETTPEGRKPLRGVGVFIDAYDEYWAAATHTDDAGRFFLCRVNAPVTVVVAGNQTSWSQSIPGTGEMFFEIELRR